jgi:hypothetical protein
MSEYFKNISKPRIVNKDYYPYLEADIEIPINKINGNHEFQDDGSSLINILLKINKDDYEIGLYFNKDKFESLKNIVSEKYYQSLDINEFLFSLKINNDLRTNCIFYPNYIYVDNEPFLSGNSITMKPRDEVNIKLSDILRDYIYLNSNYLFLKFVKEVPKTSK